MSSFKKSLFFIIPITLISFTGCFGGGDDNTTGELQNFTAYDSPGFSISRPADWKIVEAKDFSSDVPNETQIIFTDNIQDASFTANANVSKVILRQQTSSQEYAKSEIQENKNTLLNYKEISRDDEFNIVVGGQMQKTTLILFEGKQSELSPTIRVVQTYVINGTDAYTATAAYKIDADDFTVEEAKNIIKSFKVK